MNRTGPISALKALLPKTINLVTGSSVMNFGGTHPFNNTVDGCLCSHVFFGNETVF